MTDVEPSPPGTEPSSAAGAGDTSTGRGPGNNASAWLRFGCAAVVFAVIALAVLVVVGLSHYNATTGGPPMGGFVALVAAGTVLIIGLYLSAVAAGWQPSPARGPTIAIVVALFGVPLLAVPLAGVGATESRPASELCTLTPTNGQETEVEVDVTGEIGSCQRVRNVIGTLGDGGSWSVAYSNYGGKTPDFVSIPCNGWVTAAKADVYVYQLAGDDALSKATCQRLGLG